MIRELHIVCESMEIDAIKESTYLNRVKAFNVELKDIELEEVLEYLDFQDVMNYYGVSAVCEWCEANR